MNSAIMLDMETLATGIQPVILTIGACKFDPVGDEIKRPEMEVLYLRLDIESQTAVGREINDDTIAWWGRQTPEAQEEALGDGTPDNPRYTLTEAMDRLYKFCRGAKTVWSNGSVADIIWAESAYRQVQQANPWKFWEIRDCRTAYDLGINPNMPPVTAHNALEDAINQAIGIQNVFRTLQNCTYNDGTYIEPFKNWKKRG
jgi:hypothetical protein